MSENVSGMNPVAKMGFVPRGIYNSTETYDFLDFVYYDGNTYVAKKLTVGNEPQENNEYWQILAKGGIEDVGIQFNEAAERWNIQNGEDTPTLFGKIKKWYTDLKAIAWSGNYNDLENKPIIPAAVAVKGNDESTYRTGNVNLTPANIGAVATSKVLTTKEQVNANTDANNVAGAVALKNMVSEINSNLTSKDLFNSTSWVSGITNYAKSIRRVGDVVFIYVDFIVPDSYSGTYTSYPIMTGLPKPTYKYSFLGGLSIDGLFTQPMLEVDTDGKLYLQVRGTVVNGRRIFATVLYIL